MKFTLFASSALALAVVCAPMAQASTDKPMFARGIYKGERPAKQPAAGVPLWTYTWSYNGTSYSAQMIGGSNPKTSGGTTTIPTIIVPVSLTCNGTTYSANDKDALSSNGSTVLQDTLNSVIFQPYAWKSGGKSMGTTQYIDAYSRASYWGAGVKKQEKTNPWHAVLGTPTVAKTVTYKIPSGQCSVASAFGVNVIEFNINSFDSAIIQPTLKSLAVPGGTFTIFLTTQTYLTSGGCCIGGYHDYNGTQTYAHATYIQKRGVFSQNIAALSHEVGEWQFDALINNRKTPCGGLLENGDPLEGKANYGSFPVTLNGFEYDPQDLVEITYFGAPLKTSAGKQTTFNGMKEGVCQDGQ